MRRRTRHILVHVSIVALALLEISSIQQGEVVRNPRGELNGSLEVGLGPLLARPRVTPPPAAAISAPVIRAPGTVAISHVGHLPPALIELSLQKEHVRLQI
jgi:hypothetical protein